MLAFTATVSGLVAVGLLLVAGTEHAATYRAFRSLIVRQAVWPASWVGLVAVAVITSELLFGAMGLSALVLPELPALLGFGPASLLVAVSALYAAFAAYSVVLLWRRPGVPCGCSAAEGPVNVWVPVRAALMAAGCLLSAAVTDRLPSAPAAPDLLLVSLATASFVVLLGTLPAALEDPDRRHSGGDEPSLFPRSDLDQLPLENS